ncbi:MAG: hypothetical protein WBB28_07350 [Crinalium sp.]
MNQNIFHPKTEYKSRAGVSVFICLLILSGFLATSDQFLHWFVIPVTLSGILIGIDAVDWFRGRLQLFDPVGIIGLLGFHFFFIAPLLHVSWDYWMNVPPPEDWRTWLGGMAILNFLGILVYRFSRSLFSKSTKKKSLNTAWILDKRRFIFIISFALILSGVLQIGVFQRYGGIIGYINTYVDAREEFEGMGIVFMFSECFPTLAMMAFAVYAQEKKSRQTWIVLLIGLLVFLVLQLIFGGLRGSRSNTVWGLFWAVGIIHFWIRPVPKKAIPFAMIFLVLFLYIYGFYKSSGLEGLNTFQNSEERAEFAENSGRSWNDILLKDLGRSDVQAFLLYRLMKPDSDYEYAWGRTYQASVAIFIPKFIWGVERPPNKTKEGTDAQFGMGSYNPPLFASSRIYGLAGETMLNFSPFAIPFAFVLLGVLVGRFKRDLLTWQPGDIRFMFMPFLSNLCFLVLSGDSDNIVFFILKNGAIPFIVIKLSSKKELIKHGENELFAVGKTQHILSHHSNKKFRK